mmetsp:Transcript_29447/g.90091  ORF Transcript_29447/g.90091 Transcript_29447/m.90091 type:complete len:229 (-) Transcript_29447:1062-1748(-)
MSEYELASLRCHLTRSSVALTGPRRESADPGERGQRSAMAWLPLLVEEGLVGQVMSEEEERRPCDGPVDRRGDALSGDLAGQGPVDPGCGGLGGGRQDLAVEAAEHHVLEAAEETAQADVVQAVAGVRLEERRDGALDRDLRPRRRVRAVNDHVVRELVDAVVLGVFANRFEESRMLARPGDQLELSEFRVRHVKLGPQLVDGGERHRGRLHALGLYSIVEALSHRHR